MVSRKEVQRIAKLARLELTPKEIDKFRKDLANVLDYFEKLEEIKVSSVKPTSHIFGAGNVMREDIVKLNIKNQKSKRLLELAPETKDGYLKVKTIL